MATMQQSQEIALLQQTTIILATPHPVLQVFGGIIHPSLLQEAFNFEYKHDLFQSFIANNSG